MNEAKFSQKEIHYFPLIFTLSAKASVREERRRRKRKEIRRRRHPRNME